MTVIQVPDEFSLTSTIKDVIISSNTDVVFKILYAGVTILEEIYTPDADNLIRVRDLGRVFQNYLSGSLGAGVQANLAKQFNLLADSTQIAVVTVLLCSAYTTQSALKFYQDKNPMHLQYSKKLTVPLAKEYLTFYLHTDDPVWCRVIYLANGEYVESSAVSFAVAGSWGFHSYEITLAAVSALFPGVDVTSIVAYKLGAGDIYSQFVIDWNKYVDTRHFRYLNVFSCPASFIARGEVSRKRSHRFETSRIGKIEKKFSIMREDVFKVEVGRKFSKTDEMLLAEMTQSEMVEVYFRGAFREIVIFEEDSDELQRRGSFSGTSFSFRFADERLNTMIQDPAWILENGLWEDWGNWFDNAPWTD